MRILLGGEGFPIPKEAMPDELAPTDLPPQSFFLTNGTPFVKTDYVGLGYTHYEVWCVGAVGGMGGEVRIGGTGGIKSYGGGGGGGGFHHVVGLLADLPDSTPVTVGVAGADGRDGNGSYKEGQTVHPDPGGYIEYWPNPSYVAPLAGADGGYSAFGTVCKASGGKGGAPTPVYDTYRDTEKWHDSMPGGDGGQGGAGNRTTAGGGGLGGHTTIVFQPPPLSWAPDHFTYSDAVDGSWIDDIGQGGGGGRGGTYHPYDSRGLGEELYEAGSGGRGSYSFADTSVYGARQLKSDYMWLNQPKTIVPGSGGGAKINRLQEYGSRAPGANPNGAVFLRIMKVV